MHQLPAPAFAIAISEEAATVAISYPEQNVVRLYTDLLKDGSLAGAKELTTTGPAIGLAHRAWKGKGVYFVLTADDRTLRLLDEKKFEPVGQVVLNAGRPIGLAVPSDPAVPFVYYVANENSYDGRIGRINLETMADEGLINTEEIGEIATSADGRIVYGRKPGTSPSGVRAWRVADPPGKGEPPTARVLTSRHQDSQPYVADPFNATTAMGKVVLSPDLSKSLAELAFPVRAFLRTRPVILCATDDGVAAFSSNTYQPLGTIGFGEPESVEAAPIQPGVQPNRRPPTQQQQQQRRGGERKRITVGGAPLYYQTFIAANEKRNVVVYAREDKLAVAPLSALRLPKEPLLVARLEGSTEATIGEPLNLKVAKLDPQAQPSLEGVPEGMKLEKDAITWTPNASQVGWFSLRLRMKSGSVERAQDVTVVVRRPSVRVPFKSDLLALSPDGKRAVAVAVNPQSDGRGRSRRSGDGQPSPLSRIAVIDLEKRTLVAERVLSFTASQAIAVGADAVYVAAQGSDALYALSLKDLADVKRVFTTSTQFQRLTVTGDVLSAYGSRSGGGDGPLRYKLPGLEPIEEPQATRQYNPYGEWPFAEPVGDGWFTRGVVSDASGKPRLLVQPSGIVEMTSSQQVQRRMNGRDAHSSSGRVPVTTWDVALMGDQLQRMTGQTIGRVEGGRDNAILNDLPAVASLVNERTEGNNERGTPPTERTRIVLRDLISADAKQTIVLSDEPADLHNHNPENPKLLAVPGRIIALANQRVFVVDTREIDARQFTPPVHFIKEQAEFILSYDKPLTLACKAQGGKSPLRFAAATDMPGISVDTATGATTIDPAPFVARAGEYIQSVMQNNSQHRRGGGQQPEDPRAALAAFAAPVQARFKALTGRDATGYPLAIPADVLVRDDEQQTAVLNRVVLLDVPLDVITKRVEEQAAKTREQQEQIRRQQEAQRAEMQSRRPGGGGGDGASPQQQQRVAELERRIAELEAQNKLLRELLQQSPGSSPAATRPR